MVDAEYASVGIAVEYAAVIAAVVAYALALFAPTKFSQASASCEAVFVPTTASVPSPSAVFSVLLAVASLFPSVVSAALYEFSSVLPSFEFVAFVEIEDFHRKVEYFVHFGLNASVGTDVETLDIADRKHCLSEMSLCWRQR